MQLKLIPIQSFLQKLGLEDGESIQHPWISKALERAQKKVEGRNFEIRRSLLKFDNVMNEQRKIIYSQRKEIITEDSINVLINDMRNDFIEETVNEYVPDVNSFDDKTEISLKSELKKSLNLNLDFT